MICKKDLWIDMVTAEQEQQGGVWVIGDKPYSAVANYPGRNDGTLLVKSWVANRDKYGGNYPAKNRQSKKRWEYVRVLVGCLECHIEDMAGRTKVYALQYPDDGIEIPPNCLRSWALPRGEKQARGITIARRRSSFPIMVGSGLDYSFACWDWYQPGLVTVLSERLSAPADLEKWQWQYLEVFSGNLEFHTHDGDKVSLTTGNRLFRPASVKTGPWYAEIGTRGVTIFFR